MNSTAEAKHIVFFYKTTRRLTIHPQTLEQDPYSSFEREQDHHMNWHTLDQTHQCPAAFEALEPINSVGNKKSRKESKIS